MRRIITIASVLLLSVYACSPSRESQIANIKGLEIEVEETFKKTIDVELGAELMNAYKDYLSDFKDDSLDREYRYKTAKMARSINDAKCAVEYFKSFLGKYPDDAKAPEAMLLLGSVYESKLYMLDEAELIYQEFLKRYPDHEFAPIAKTSLENIDKTPQEILKQ